MEGVHCSQAIVACGSMQRELNFEPPPQVLAFQCTAKESNTICSLVKISKIEEKLIL